MKALTVGNLKDWLLQKGLEGLITDDYEICVWVKDGSGSIAYPLEDLTYHEPDTDHNEGFIAFHHMPDAD